MNPLEAAIYATEVNHEDYQHPQEYYVETQLIPNSRTLTGSHQFTPSNFLFYFFINLKR